MCLLFGFFALIVSHRLPLCPRQIEAEIAAEETA